MGNQQPSGHVNKTDSRTLFRVKINRTMIVIAHIQVVFCITNITDTKRSHIRDTKRRNYTSGVDPAAQGKIAV